MGRHWRFVNTRWKRKEKWDLIIYHSLAVIYAWLDQKQDLIKLKGNNWYILTDITCNDDFQKVVITETYNMCKIVQKSNNFTTWIWHQPIPCRAVYFRQTKSKPFLLMLWPLGAPCHQHHRLWLWVIPCLPLKMNFDDLCRFNVNDWYELQIHIHFTKKFSS